MNLWAQLALPVRAWLPLSLAALAPVLLAVIALLSRRRGRGIATALTLRTLLVLAVGFAILVTVSTVAVVHTGVRELRQRHASTLSSLVETLERNPLGLASRDARLRLSLFGSKDPNLGFLIAGSDACRAVCLISYRDNALDAGVLRQRVIDSWATAAWSQKPVSIAGGTYLLIAAPLQDAAGKPRSAVIAGVNAAYLADQAARTAWLLLGISYCLLVLVGWTSWKQVSRSLATSIHEMNEQLRSGVVGAATHESLEVDGHELRELADSVSAYIRRTLEEKSSSDERHRRLAELSPDAVLICADRRIRSANPAAIALAGAKHRSDLVASPIDRFLQFDDAESGDASSTLRPATWRRLDGRALHVEVAEVTDSSSGELVRQFVVRDVTNRTLREADLAHRAAHDSLTGLVNRARFESRLHELLNGTTGTPGKFGKSSHVAVIFIDLDEFKPVNDTHGHAAGDAMLIAVAARLRDSTRGSDLIARLGGDEFAVLLEVRDADEVSAVAERILRALRQPVVHERAMLVIGASLGIACARPANDEYPTPSRSAAELVRAADEAMYAAKSSGGDRYLFAPASGQSTDADSDVRFPAVA